MNKALKIGAISVVSVALLGLSGVMAFQGASVYAATPANTVFEKVLEKLGIKNVTADQLKTALDTSRDEVRATELETRLSEAVTAKKITQAQADLAKKLFTVREKQRDEMRTKFEAMTDAEREALRGTKPNEANKEAVAKELGISETELTTLETALREADVLPMGGRGMGMGMGKGMGEGRMIRGQ